MLTQASMFHCMAKAHNQPIKCAPCGRRTLVPRAAYWGRYNNPHS